MSLTKQDKQYIQETVDTTVNKAVEELSEVIAALAQNMHNEILSLHKEIIGMNQTLETKASQDSIDRLVSTIDAFVKRLDDDEIEQTARDAQFEKLLVWAREVSAKTGIPLNGL